MLNYKSLELGIVRHHFIVVILGCVIVTSHQSFEIYVLRLVKCCGKLKSLGISFGRTLKYRYINLRGKNEWVYRLKY